MVGNASRDLLDPRLRCRGGAVAGRVGARAAERAHKAPQIRRFACLTVTGNVVQWWPREEDKRNERDDRYNPP